MCVFHVLRTSIVQELNAELNIGFSDFTRSQGHSEQTVQTAKKKNNVVTGSREWQKLIGLSESNSLWFTAE